jgi:hypothetical protein
VFAPPQSCILVACGKHSERRAYWGEQSAGEDAEFWDKAAPGERRRSMVGGRDRPPCRACRAADAARTGRHAARGIRRPVRAPRPFPRPSARPAPFLVLGQQGNSFVLPSVWTVRQVVLLARTLLRVEERRRLPFRLLSSARRVRRPSMSGLCSVTVRGLVAGTSM